MPTIETDTASIPDISETPRPAPKKNSEAKLYIILGLIVLLGGGAMYGLNKITEVSNKPPAPSQPALITAAQVDEVYDKARHKKGDPKATFTVVEFADFQCPSCRRAYEKTISNWDNKIPAHRFGFYHLPLTEMHERAMPAAIASEAAAKQGKFWEMYTEFFQKDNEDLTDKTFTDVAKKIGLNMTQFEADQKNSAPLEALVNADLQYATQRGANSTPTFYIHDASGNTAVLAGAGNLGRLLPDLKDGIIGNDKIAAPDPTSNPADRIHLNVGGKAEDL